MAYTKQYIEGTVLSFDGRVYTFLLPGEETAVLKHSTVHERCQFPTHLMEDDHLKVGATIHLCSIEKEDKKRAVLPDHRFYFFTKFKKMPDGTIVSQDNKKALKDVSQAIETCAKTLAQGDSATAIFLLRAILSQIDPTI